MPVLAPPRLLTAEVLGSNQVSVLAVTWQHPFTREISAIGILARNVEGTYSFNYVRNVLNIQDFQPLVGFADLYQAYESDRLFPLFAQRVMDPRRPDYVSFIASLGLSNEPSPWEQLERSGGGRAGDTLQLRPVPSPVEGVLDTWEVSFLVHGMRHISGKARTLGGREVNITRNQLEASLNSLRPGEILQLIPEPTNPKNHHAVVVADSKGVPLGYLPDIFTDDLAHLDPQGVTCTVEIINGPTAPWQMRLVAKLRCVVPPGFQFFATSSWQTLASS